MTLWMRVLGAGMLALGLAAAAPRAADAALVEMSFPIAGPWNVAGGPPPYGLPANPTLQVNAVLDNTRSGAAAFVSFSLVTGTRTWTLADGILFALVDFAIDGTVSDLLLALDDGRLVLGGNSAGATGSTFAISEDKVSFACNTCFVVSSRVLPVPTPAALALFGMGLIGLGAARRLSRRAA